jgi:hypothetical protein
LTCDGTPYATGIAVNGAVSGTQPTGSDGNCSQYMQMTGTCNNQLGGCANQVGNMMTCTGQFTYFTFELPTG